MTGQYFEEQPAVASAPRTVRLHTADLDLRFVTDRGVFSFDGIDLGTRVLLEVAPPPPAGDALDLGCGYGPIAVALAVRNPAARVWAVDVNERARALTVQNAQANNAGNVVVSTPEEIDPELTFAALYSNPPMHIGKPALHALLEQWLARLQPAAHGWLVVQRHLGADSLQRWLDEHGFGAHRAASRKGYRVFDVTAAE